MTGELGAPGAIRLWTAQEPIVWETIRRDGVSRVRTRYVEEKYRDVAWSFQEAYAFFRARAASIVPPPPGAESGIWLHVDRRWVYASPGSRLIELEVPRDRCVLFDLRCWNRIINMRYVPTDEADEAAFDAELARQGVGNPTAVFSTPFHPMLKRRVRESWERLFSSAEGCPDTYLEAGVWEIRREWVRSSELIS